MPVNVSGGPVTRRERIGKPHFFAMVWCLRSRKPLILRERDGDGKLGVGEKHPRWKLREGRNRGPVTYQQQQARSDYRLQFSPPQMILTAVYLFPSYEGLNLNWRIYRERHPLGKTERRA
ncbi:Hypothetical protein NTJ_06995 [Nesidiocoris tenuis]|uniref:Uncharacterized protein n=1 Tax=Nesidiocoris tenuis TaxID=355587 RepID=A0ABN7ATH1_9HEMI|nr:Hypothetical protein NTJ_06995 [Nesidiocoris tenuis]